MHQDTLPCWNIDYSTPAITTLEIDEYIEIFEAGTNPTADQAADAGSGRVRAHLVTGHCKPSSPLRATQSECCRWLLQQLLQHMHPLDCRSWSVTYHANGAPLLLHDGQQAAYHLSFSHSGNHFAAALSTGPPIAVDIERYGSGRDYAALGAYLGWQPKTANEAAFLARWTLWEACAKISSQSVLSARIAGFEQLSSVVKLNQLVCAGNWYALQSLVQERAYVSCVLNVHEQTVLSFRWPDLAGLKPNVPEEIIPCPEATLL